MPGCFRLKVVQSRLSIPSMPGGFRLGLIAISLQLGQERLGHLG
jgi:hypothetical protein